MKNYKNIVAFTLAEVLISLLIIGIVASMVIPALIQNTQDAELITAWKKTYSDVDQATKRLLIDNCGSLVGLFSDSYIMRNKYAEYLSYTRSCDSASKDGCWALGNQYYSISGLPWAERTTPALVLSNGSFLYFELNYPNCDKSGWNIMRCGAIGVDVNGLKKPNKFGKDIFYIHILKNGIKPAGLPEDSTDHCDITTCENSVYCGLGCGAKYLLQ